ncbi:MAG: hypothetical protein KatS3mg076_3175 [Candidatus Binatia bacterium]|nr:MAG: hypothetical protein KatS3mg076_3175 [Candidatus Binatia bacterium]
MAARTLTEGLEGQVARDPGAVAFVLESLENPPLEVRRGPLREGALRMARGLVSLGLRRGGRVLLMLPTSVEFVELFFGTLDAGGTPVPAYPPVNARQLADLGRSLEKFGRTSGTELAVLPGFLRDGLPVLEGVRVTTPEEIREAGKKPVALPPPPGPDDLALVQFSSGSTGDPKGICLSHANILSNILAFADRLQQSSSDVCVTWLPLYHDMGLIGTLLAPILRGVPLALLSPLDFLRRPVSWIRLLSKYRATIGVAPQFAYSLCARKVDPGELSDLDLSCVRVLLNGAEPIHPEGIDAFEEKLAPLGLRRGVVTPCYGLGEATLAVTMRAPGSGAPSIDVPVAEGTTMRVASVGPPVLGTEVRIRDERGNWLPEDRIGEICVRGPSVCVGYLRGDRIEPATDAEGWLPTGDLGLLHGGELYVTGRKKDLVIVGGRNLYPQEIEAEAGKIAGVRPGRIVAFGIAEPRRDTEALVVVAEAVDDRRGEEIVGELRRSLLAKFGVAPYDVLLVGKGEVPRTTSGKLRRSEARAMYLGGNFSHVLYRLRSAP